MDGRRMSNVQTNSRLSTSFKGQQIEIIGKLRIVVMYSASEYYDMRFIFGQSNGKAFQTNKQIMM